MRLHLLAATALVTSLMATDALAQAAPAAPAAETVEAVVVTGSRSAPRAALNTLAPVDVISATQMTHIGSTDLAQALSEALPSLNFTHPAVTDGTDSLRPATLRGMSPDQTLVLIDSKRAHTSSLVNLNGSVGYGAAAMDLNTIPLGALANVEVLRDGASAQYGSDAIAGVINLRLREARSGGDVSVTTGVYDTNVNYNTTGAPNPTGAALPGSRHLNDGATTTVSGWKGFSLGDKGFVTATLEYKTQAHTTRAGPDPRQQYPLVGTAFDPREQTFSRIDNWYGDPKLDQYTGYLNAGYDMSGEVHLYAFGGFQHRDSNSAANVRRAIQETSVPATNLLAVYPNGYLPKIHGQIDDATVAGGAKFATGPWSWDASLTYGYNRFKFGVIDTINVSLGPNSPTTFNAGGPQYQQTVANLDGTRKLSLLGMSDVNLAVGAEVRTEQYRIFAGEPASYANGGYVTPSKTVGAAATQGFPGFSPSDAVSASRTSESLYADIESKPIDNLDIDIAGRYENYSDFGSELTGKLAARYDFNSNFALRGAISSGFRAPSLQQEYISYSAITFLGGQQITNAVLRASNPVASFIGAIPLKPEQSTNYSVGGVFRAGPFSATLDGYIIRLNNRITLSDPLTQANVLALFPASAQIGAARFFTNGVDTTTTGQDFVATYKWRPTGDIGRFDFSLSASHNQTTINAIRSTPQLSALNPAPAFLTNYRIESLTKGQPNWKSSLVTDWTYGRYGLTATATYYGSLLQPFNTGNTLGDYTLAAKTLIDLEGRATVGEHVHLSLGVQNLFDTYPTTPPYVLNGQNISTNGVGQFPEYSPFGFNGRFVYVKVGYAF